MSDEIKVSSSQSVIWLDMNQAALDAAYDQTKYAPNHELLRLRRSASAAIARKRLPPPRRFQYGPTPVEGLDVYLTDSPNGPINVFIHGGAWRSGTASDFAALAEVFVHSGANLVVPDFTTVDDVDGNLFPMVDQVRRAVAWVYQNAAKFGADPTRLYVSGHSSGCHLAGNIVVTDWRKNFGLPETIIKGALLASGMYDLKPVRFSARSRYVKFTDEMEQELSSIRHLDCLHCPLVVAYGDQETPEFQRQSRDFVAAVKAAGKDVELIVAEGFNHFEILETLANPYGLLGFAVLGQMKLRE